MGYLQIPDGMLVPLHQARGIPPEKLVLMTTGSQGEPTSALVRIANQDHRDVRVLPGDTVIISATPIPGNELLVSRTIDKLLRQGAKVLYDRIALVHVHGHASQEELKMMLNLVRPRFFVPVHGEYRHMLAHADLAEAMGVGRSGIFVLEDGNVLELTPDRGEVTDSVPAGHVYVDGSEMMGENNKVLQERRSLGHDGVIVVAVALDRNTGFPAKPPQVYAAGFTDDESCRSLFQKLSESVSESLEQNDNFPIDWGLANKVAKEAATKLLHREAHRSPLVVVACLEV
jgi:ribonuclease J